MLTSEELILFEQDQERKEALEHRDALLAIASLIKSTEGRKFFRYLFKTLDVAQLPDQNIEGNMLHEYLGFLRAGNAIYKLTCEADPDIAASILSKLERERYDELCERYRNEN